MTLIIGAKFKDGVILVSDRKVTNPDSPNDEWSKKLKLPYPNSPICFGAAGYQNKYNQFNRKIIEIAAEHMRETEIKNKAFLKKHGLNYPKEEKETEVKKLDKEDIEKATNVKENVEQDNIALPYVYSMEHFLEDSEDLVRKLCTGQDGIIRPLLEVLVILLYNNQARLHHIDFDGDEDEGDYFAIGSGAEYIKLFLSKFWSKEMDIEEIFKLACFCIYYVQDLGLDRGVGMEEGILPNHYVVTPDPKVFGYYNGFDGKEKEIINGVRKDVKKFKRTINSLKFQKNKTT